LIKLPGFMSYMDQLDKIEILLSSKTAENLPPIHKWNPPFSGSIEITIKENGDWYHEGVKFTRQSLVKLFSSILKREGDEYFLVTPVEKWKINVEGAPLLVTDMDVIENPADGRWQIIKFQTSTDDIFPLNELHSLQLSTKNNGVYFRPYVLVRNNLEALIHRNVFYRLADIAQNIDGAFGVWSEGTFFKLQ
jgi:hypothetical protein